MTGWGGGGGGGGWWHFCSWSLVLKITTATGSDSTTLIIAYLTLIITKNEENLRVVHDKFGVD